MRLERSESIFFFPVAKSQTHSRPSSEAETTWQPSGVTATALERSFAWLGSNRRLSKDYEYCVQEARTIDRQTNIDIQISNQCGRLIANVIIYYNTEFD
jgi:hypothetical protein